jgi:signal transduction histidine kinase
MVVQEKLASLGSLTAGIAHEIKNPLNFINNFAGLNLELTGELDEAFAGVRSIVPQESRAEIDEALRFLKENSEKIQRHGRQADSIVQGMLAHSRGRRGEFEPVDVNATVEEHMKLAYHGMRARETSFNASMEYDLDPGLGPVRAVSQDLARVLLNIIHNACYAVHEKKRTSGPGYMPVVRATTRDLGSSVEVRIWDNGTGMPPEVAERVFNPFFTTKPAGEGTGLGLSIAFDIITREHGGTLTVQTRDGESTEFVISLPKDPAPQHG